MRKRRFDNFSMRNGDFSMRKRGLNGDSEAARFHPASASTPRSEGQPKTSPEKLRPCAQPTSAAHIRSVRSAREFQPNWGSRSARDALFPVWPTCGLRPTVTSATRAHTRKRPLVNRGVLGPIWTCLLSDRIFDSFLAAKPNQNTPRPRTHFGSRTFGYRILTTY